MNFLEFYDKKDKKKNSFLDNRLSGAIKISHTAKSKGGDAILTHQHFDAKIGPYKELRSRNEKTISKYCLAKTKQKLSRILSSIESLSQEEFQRLMGEAEVYGEVYIKMK